MQRVKSIDQRFIRLDEFPHVELRSTYSSLHSYKAHSHISLSIGAIQTGGTCLTCGGEQFHLQQGDLVIIEPELVHACNPLGQQARSYHMLYVDLNWCQAVLGGLYDQPVTAVRCDQRVIRNPELFDRYLTLVSLFERPSDLQSVALDQFLFSVLSAYCSPFESVSEESKISGQLKRILLDRLAEPPLLDELALQFGVAKETLIRHFSKHYGITPKAFVQNARIEESKLMLRSGMRIVDVALSLGFSDQSQFHKAFVNFTSSTPQQYQKSGSIFDNK
ncbi:AraC family transcriptional regulator [Litoribacillus peritrichatus]|uniref:AraC family transcriptional regulator n=1 Tax=Litoribacillus peritrichatus TaxID=718191 RepID=A0ABP7MVW2_9GAMM